MAEEILIESPSGEMICALINQPGDAAVREAQSLILMIHGFPGQKDGHNDFFGSLEVLLAAGGHHTARFDFRGCGASDGKSEQFTFESACEDFQNMLLWAKTQGYQRFGYIAEGFGASLALLNPAPALDFMVLAWPVLDPPQVFDYYFVKNEPARQERACEGGQRVSQGFVDSLKGADYARAIAAIRTPLLILHGAKDERSPIDQLELIRQHFRGPRAEITTFEDGTHGLPEDTHRKMVFHHVTRFAERYSVLPRQVLKKA